MTEHLSPDSPDHEGNGRRAAHERLSTGALARWARACATHPWRVIVSSVGAIVLLAFAVGAFGGSLKDEFEIPGSDTQKATDLIESEFASEQGGVLNVVVAAPEGERLDKPVYRAAILKAVARLQSPEFKPTEDEMHRLVPLRGPPSKRRPVQLSPAAAPARPVAA